VWGWGGGSVRAVAESRLTIVLLLYFLRNAVRCNPCDRVWRPGARCREPPRATSEHRGKVTEVTAWWTSRSSSLRRKLPRSSAWRRAPRRWSRFWRGCCSVNAPASGCSRFSKPTRRAAGCGCCGCSRLAASCSRCRPRAARAAARQGVTVLEAAPSSVCVRVRRRRCRLEAACDGPGRTLAQARATRPALMQTRRRRRASHSPPPHCALERCCPTRTRTLTLTLTLTRALTPTPALTLRPTDT
jgi:hypothetical protein